MNVQCLSCGVEKNTGEKEVYPYPEDGMVDEPIRPVFFLDCQDGEDWRKVVVCHECFHRLAPDQWISRRCWETLEPMTPFEALPLADFRSDSHRSQTEKGLVEAKSSK